MGSGFWDARRARCCRGPRRPHRTCSTTAGWCNSVAWGLLAMPQRDTRRDRERRKRAELKPARTRMTWCAAIIRVWQKHRNTAYARHAAGTCGSPPRSEGASRTQAQSHRCVSETLRQADLLCSAHGHAEKGQSSQTSVREYRTQGSRIRCFIPCRTI